MDKGIKENHSAFRKYNVGEGSPWIAEVHLQTRFFWHISLGRMVATKKKNI